MDDGNIMNALIKSSRGMAWTLEEFQAQYGLGEAEARRLFTKFGPYSNDLKVLMAAKMKRDLVSSAEILNISP